MAGLHRRTLSSLVEQDAACIAFIASRPTFYTVMTGASLAHRSRAVLEPQPDWKSINLMMRHIIWLAQLTRKADQLNGGCSSSSDQSPSGARFFPTVRIYSCLKSPTCLCERPQLLVSHPTLDRQRAISCGVERCRRVWG